MSSTAIKSKNLYNSIKIPLRSKLYDLTQDFEAALLLNQIIFSNKQSMSINDVARISLYDKSKQTIRKKMNILLSKNLITKSAYKKLIYNQDLYEPTDAVITDEGHEILGLVEGIDLQYNSNYLSALILNKLRTYALSGISEFKMSIRQIKEMLGVTVSDTSVRNIMKQLTDDNYVNRTLSRGIYSYKINVSKITNNYSVEDIENYTKDILAIYEYYANFNDVQISKRQLNSYKLTIKRMINDGISPLELEHIFISLALHPSDEVVTPSHIKKYFDKYSKNARILSKRKARRFYFKLKNNLLIKNTTPKEKIVVSDVEIWNNAINYCNDNENALKRWYNASISGVTDVEFDDFKQEAIKLYYEQIKKNPENMKNYKYTTVRYRLKDFMYKRRCLTDYNGNKNAIASFEYDFDNLNIIKDEPIEEITVNIDNILSQYLDDRTIFIIKSYIGCDGHKMTFQEIGKLLYLSESLVARIYKKAIQILRSHYPPDKLNDFKNLLFNS